MRGGLRNPQRFLQPTPTSTLTTRRVYTKRAAPVVLATALAAGCTSATTAQPAPSSLPPTLTSSAIAAQVLDAWRAGHVAYAAAIRAMDPHYPALTQTTIDPALRSATAFIATSKAQGILAQGWQDLGSPKVISLTPSTDPRMAVVQSCIHDGLVLINGHTRKPVPGLPGRVTWGFEHTTLRHVEGVGWLVADNVVNQDDKESVCAAH